LATRMTWKVASEGTTRDGRRQPGIGARGHWSIRRGFPHVKRRLRANERSRAARVAGTSERCALASKSVRTVRAARADRSRVRVPSRQPGSSLRSDRPRHPSDSSHPHGWLSCLRRTGSGSSKGRLPADSVGPRGHAGHLDDRLRRWPALTCSEGAT
jgi:hypothetical protein